MKVIVSHDVDHIDSFDHILKDLFFEKLFIRSLILLIKGKISFTIFMYRITLIFHKRINRIKELMEFDREHKIPSVFFFGMSNTLSMSYSLKKAKKYINIVQGDGYDVGVHGCEYIDVKKMKREYDSFSQIVHRTDFGIRNHYVRYNQTTFEKMEECGYLFDSTYFNKNKIYLKKPYKIGKMWEFPLHIMDVYVYEEGRLKESLNRTYSIIDEAEKEGIEFLTILFHDCRFNRLFDPEAVEWYIETIKYCESKKYEFVSYRDAIKELENNVNKICE